MHDVEVVQVAKGVTHKAAWQVELAVVRKRVAEVGEVADMYAIDIGPIVPMALIGIEGIGGPNGDLVP